MLTPEHREKRRTGMGGSDIATNVGAIIGDDTIYGEPTNVWLEKVGLAPERDDEDAEHFWFGHAHERTVSARYAIRTGRRLTKVKGDIIRHPKYGHFFASPDRLIVGGKPPRGMEIKVQGAWSKQRGHWGPDGSTEVPGGPFVQVIWYMFCTGFRFWDIASLITPTEMRVYTIRYDEELAEYLADTGDEFWRKYVLPKEPPPPGSVKMSDYLHKILHPKDNGKIRAATADEVELIYEDAGLKASIAEQKKEQAAIRSQLKNGLGDYSAILTPGGKEFSFRAPAEDIKTTAWKKLVFELGGNQDDIDRHTITKAASRRVSNGVKITLDDGE